MIKSDFVRFRGKHFSGDDLAVFRRIIEENWQTSRCAISREICRQFNWRQPNGHLKEGICRTLLVRLERKNMIELPEPIRMPEPVPADIKPKPVTIDQTPIRGPVEEVKNQLSFLEVKKTPQEKVYNSLTEQFSGGYRRPIERTANTSPSSIIARVPASGSRLRRVTSPAGTPTSGGHLKRETKTFT